MEGKKRGEGWRRVEERKCRHVERMDRQAAPTRFPVYTVNKQTNILLLLHTVVISHAASPPLGTLSSLHREPALSLLT